MFLNTYLISYVCIKNNNNHKWYHFFINHNNDDCDDENCAYNDYNNECEIN